MFMVGGGGSAGGLRGAGGHWLEERDVERGMNLEGQGKLQSYRTWVDDPIYLKRTNKPRGQFLGFGLERQVPG